MHIEKVKKIISRFPDTTGVYIFRARRGGGNGEGKILYIGKATSLRDRVRSYMSKGVFDTRSPLVAKMLSQFDTIDYIKTDSVLEALILEANLIKKHQPEANIKEKDNRSFNFVVITKEDYPRVLVVRGRELNSKVRPWRIIRHRVFNTEHSVSEDVSHIFGPFPNGGQLKEALKIIRKMFPYRDKCNPAEALLPQKNKPCFNRQIGLCPGVCTGEITKEDYARQIKNIILFFQGNKKRLLKTLEKQMKSFAKVKEFERANIIKRTLFSLNHIQDISLIKNDWSTWQVDQSFRIESYDVAHMSGQNVVGVMTVVEDGELKHSDYRKFKIKSQFGGDRFGGLTAKAVKAVKPLGDTGALAEVLTRRLAHIEWRFPDLIVVDGGTAQKRVMEKVLRENKVNILVVSIVKDERHKPKQILGDRKWLEHEREILLSNSEAHRFAIGFHKKLRGKIK